MKIGDIASDKNLNLYEIVSGPVGDMVLVKTADGFKYWVFCSNLSVVE